MDMVAAFVSNGQAAVAMEPCVGALSHPAIDAQPTAMPRPATSEGRDGALGIEAIAMGLGIVAAITWSTSGRRRFGRAVRGRPGNAATSGFEPRDVVLPTYATRAPFARRRHPLSETTRPTRHASAVTRTRGGATRG